MSSKVFPRGEALPAEPLVWRSVNGTAAASSRAQEKPDEATLLKARIAELENALERRIREARDAGFREGEQAGREQAGKELQPVLDKFARTIREIAELRPTLRRQAEEDVVKLSLAVARRILHREISIEPDALRGLIDVALQKLASQEISRVRTHPEHVAAVRASLESGGRARVEVLADPACERGTAIFETERGDLDASAGTQLREIGQGLADRLREVR